MQAKNIFSQEEMISILRVPSVSKYESFMASYVEEWAKINKIGCFKDDFNNLYLTKGKLNKNEYYPCITAHLDTVQKAQISFVEKGIKLPIVIEESVNSTKVYCDGFGIGGDCKCGIIAALNLLKIVDKIKIAFFVEEEIGMNGSKNMMKSFFNDIGYAISFDSPENNRGAYTCNGIKLFSEKFYNKKIKRVCNKYHYTNFFNEPSTDIVNIKAYTNVACMVFGSGFYFPHTDYEYVILEDIENAIKFGYALIKRLKYRKYVDDCNTESALLNNRITTIIEYLKNRDEKIINILENKCKKLNINSSEEFSEIYDLLNKKNYK